MPAKPMNTPSSRKSSKIFVNGDLLYNGSLNHSEKSCSLQSVSNSDDAKEPDHGPSYPELDEPGSGNSGEPLVPRQR